MKENHSCPYAPLNACEGLSPTPPYYGSPWTVCPFGMDLCQKPDSPASDSPAIIIDKSLDSDSNNAIANAPVSTAIDNLSDRMTTLENTSAETLNALSERVAGIETSGVAAAVYADEITVSANSSTDNKVSLASVAKSVAGTHGTVQVTSGTMPAAAEDTVYNVYKDITTGNATGIDGIVNGTIQLAAGSKIVPAGGFVTLPVRGGEGSWVHSSDIGMVQVDESWYGDSSKRTALRAQGRANKAILERLAETKYDLVLDGTYYIEVTASATKDVSDYVHIGRRLRLRGGGLDYYGGLLCIDAGGGLECDGVRFRRMPGGASSYRTRAVFVRPQKTMLGGIALRDCVIEENTARWSTFMESIAPEVMPADADKDALWTVSHMVMKGYAESQIAINEDGDTVYVFGSAYTVSPVYNDEGDQVGYAVTRGTTEITEDKWFDNADEAHTLGDRMLVESSTGTWVFAVPTSSQSQQYECTDRHGGESGFYCLQSNLPSGVATDGKKYDYGTISGGDTADEMGVESFEMSGCRVSGQCVSLDDITIRDKHVVESCEFRDVRGKALAFGAANANAYALDWRYRSADCIVRDCSFYGPGAPVLKTSQEYVCALLFEGNVVRMSGCKVSNLFATSSGSTKKAYPTYESYLTAREVVFTGNTIHNVFALPHMYGSSVNQPKGEWGKSKGGKRYKSRGLVRRYTDNVWDVDYAEAWALCEEYMTETFPATASDADRPRTVFDQYAMRQRLFAYTSKAIMSELTFERNVLRHPHGVLHQAVLTGINNFAERVTLRDNVLDFKSYQGGTGTSTSSGVTRLDYTDYPLLVLKKKDSTQAALELTVEGNTIKSGTPQYVQLATIGGLYSSRVPDIESVVIRNNVLDGCNLGLSGGDYYRGRITPRVCDISGNKVLNASGIEEKYRTHLSVITIPTGGISLSGHPFFVRPAEGGRVEVADYGVTRPLLLEMPLSAGHTFGLRTGVLRRYCVKSLSGKPYTDHAVSSDIVLHWGDTDTLLPNTSWSVDIGYVLHGEQKTAHMELHHTSATAYAALMVRDCLGLLKGSYSTGARYRVPTSVEELGLGVLAEFYDGTSSEGAGYMHLHLFTDRHLATVSGVTSKRVISVSKDSGLAAGDAVSTDGGGQYTISSIDTTAEDVDVLTFGEDVPFDEGDEIADIWETRNDPGTEITVEVRRGGRWGLFSGNANPKSTGRTRLRRFVPQDSVVSQDWLETVAGGFSYTGSGGSTLTGKYLISSDAGYRVICDGEYKVWSGTEWKTLTY